MISIGCMQLHFWFLSAYLIMNRDIFFPKKFENKMIYKNIKYIPGLYKIFDEILSNAIDESLNNNFFTKKFLECHLIY